MSEQAGAFREERMRALYSGGEAEGVTLPCDGFPNLERWWVWGISSSDDA